MSAPDHLERLPADEVAEKTLLGICLLDPGQIKECAAIAPPNDFFFETAKTVWRELLRRDASNEEISIVSVGMAMNEQVGVATVDAAFVAELTTGIPRGSSGKYYAGVIAKKAHLRRLLVVARDIAVSAAVPGADPKNIAARLKAAGEGVHAENGAGVWASAQTMGEFLAADDGGVLWLVAGLLALGNLTLLFSPRGLGKTLLAVFYAVMLARAGRRVLYLDRDNGRHTLRARLLAFGADAEGTATLKALARDKCPPLTRPEEWAIFPWADYDVVIVDSLDSMAPGTGEQDSSRISRCLEPLLDICHREGGPAVLVLGNCIKSASHSRGSGVVEDRADIVIEARDATDFHPTGSKPWVEELPEQGAAAWQQRSGRRKQRERLRLAMAPTKFRLGEEPAPWIVEIDLQDEPWSVRDVTAEVDAAGERERQERRDAKTKAHAAAVELLKAEVNRRQQAGEPELTWRGAEAFLTGAGLKRQAARAAISDPTFEAVAADGRSKVVRVLGKNEKDGAIPPIAKPAPIAAASDAELRRPRPEPTAQSDVVKPQYPCGAAQQPNCAEVSTFTPPLATADADERALALRHAIKFARATTPPAPEDPFAYMEDSV